MFAKPNDGREVWDELVSADNSDWQVVVRWGLGEEGSSCSGIK